MPIIPFLIIAFLLMNKQNKNRRVRKPRKLGKGFWIPAIICLFMSGGVGWFFVALAITFKLFINAFSKNSSKESEEDEEAKQAYELEKEMRQRRNKAIPKSEQLPDAVPKRTRIVENFSKKYGLNLTSSQIQTIVDVSYFSTDWEYLIISMKKEYATIHQWFRAPMGEWLRIYLKVFNVQTVSSDMEQQKQICLDSFDQIFRSIDLSAYNTPAWNIENVNNTYMTNFDDISFMIAYRFLEANGRKYKLGQVQILKADEELAQLRKKYDEKPSGAH